MGFSVSDQVEDVRHAFGQLIDGCDVNSCLDQSSGRTVRRDDFVAEVIEASEQFHRFLLILIRYSGDNRPGCRDFHACADQAFI
ncbi:hypothetical protein D3C76_1560800 [compost metagenome]